MLTARRDQEERPAPFVSTAILLTLFILVSAAGFLAANYAVNVRLASVDKAPVRAHLAAAFQNRDLGLVESRGGDAVMGVHQTNDCLIYDMAARDASDPTLYLFGGARTKVYRAGRVGNCEALRDWLAADPGQSFGETWYLRYIHGYRVAAVALLATHEVPAARAWMKSASYGVFLLVLGFNVAVAIAAARRGWRAALVSPAWGYATIGAVTPLFFGLPYFGQSISHAPALVTLGLFILAWSALHAAGRLREWTALALIVVYALFTAYFEFLTGYIPVGVSIICLLVAIGWADQPSAWRTARMLILGLYSFVTSLVAAFALHVVATAVNHEQGAQTVSLFLDRLRFRMSQNAATREGDVGFGDALDIGDVALALLQQFPHLGFLDERATMVVLLASVLVCVLCSLDALAAGRTWRDAVPILLAGGSFLPICMWILLFQNHTAVHASFMVRILVAFPLAGSVTLWMWTRAVLIRAPALQRDGGAYPAFA